MAAVSRGRSRATVGWRGRLRRRLGTGGSEGGAVLVEAAFVIPVFLLLLFGMIEFGFVFKDSLTLSTMVQTGARTGAVIGNGSSPSVDYEILSTMAAESKALNAHVQSVVIFDANGSTKGVPVNAVPPQCLSGTSVANLCNVYSAQDWADIVSGTQTGQNFADACTTSGVPCWDQSWLPSSRKVATSDNGGSGPDFLGIYITAHHTKVTGFFGSLDLHETDIIRLEPQSFS